MATTKSRSTGTRSRSSNSSTRSSSAKPRSTSKSSSRSSRSSSRNSEQGMMQRATRTISERPYTTAAIATGAVTAIAAAAAGAFFFSRTNRDGSERTMDDLTDRIKDGLDEARTATGSMATKLGSIFGWNSDQRSDQSDIAEEALTLKETGKKKNSMVDAQSNQEIKAGATAY